jgi:hypothetical protein
VDDRSIRLLIAILCCAVAAWLSGPAGRLCVVLPLLLFGPGYVLERGLAAYDAQTLALRPAIWLGLSLSIVALFYEWATALRLALSLPALYLLALACALAVAWRFLQESIAGDRHSPSGVGAGMRGAGRWWLALLALLALIGWTRYEQISDLALPAWVDSLHHALMIRVAAEQGQAPYSLRPYLPVDLLPYHWGYHVFVAAAMQLSGLTLGPAMLWSGQVLNTLQALVAAALAAYLWRRPLAGISAALVVGLLSIMPAYYVSWGRYTQLTGMLLLPPIMIAWHAGLRGPARGRLICLGVLLAGLCLVHFRVLMFALAFIAVSGSGWAIANRLAGFGSRLRFAALSAALALALSAPWLWVIARRTLLPAFSRPSSLGAGGSYNTLTDGLVWAGHNRILFALALVAALWGVARRKQAAVEHIGWVAAMALMANPVLVGLPYLWLITNDVFVISLFLPAGVLLGGGASLLLELVERLEAQHQGQRTKDKHQRLTIEDRGSRIDTLSSILDPLASILRSKAVSGRRLVVRGIALVLFAALALWGAFELRRVVNPGTVLATEADVQAINWAAEQTRPDARFLVNATPWLSIQRGADGGWWLLPLTGRWVSAPPVIYTYGSPEYISAVAQLNKPVLTYQKGQSQPIYDLVEREQIDYIYLSKRAGPLTVETFANNPLFEIVYQQAGVTILAVHR